MTTYDELSNNPALRVTVASGETRWADFLAEFPIEQAGAGIVDIVRAGEDHPQFGAALSDLLTFGRVRDYAGRLWGIIDLWEVAGAEAHVILERY